MMSVREGHQASTRRASVTLAPDKPDDEKSGNCVRRTPVESFAVAGETPASATQIGRHTDQNNPEKSDDVIHVR